MLCSRRNALSDKTMYFVSKDGSPIALYIGKVQIAVREGRLKRFCIQFPDNILT